MTRVFDELASDIAEDFKNWLLELECHEPSTVARRNKDMSKIGDLFRAALGFFVSPRLQNAETLYIFEGIRYKEYMKVFRPETIIVVGSHIEKDFAKLNGYKFCWAFPMVCAVHSQVIKGLNIFLNRQIKLWIKELSRANQIIFFLYEDTQPLGCYFVHIGRFLKSKATSVCIQHGYFCNRNIQLRYDGQLSAINFVWDERQIAVIGCNRSTTFEIGLPYVAIARPTNELIVVLVGTGMYAGQYGEYEEYGQSINAFSAIKAALRHSLGLKVFYRPHPNEWISPNNVVAMNKHLSPLDDLDKVRRLNGPRSLYIGTISSLLYEAGVAGHFVARLKLDGNSISVFDFDFEFDTHEISALVKWVSTLDASPCTRVEWKHTGEDYPTERFVSALHSAKLLDINDIAANRKHSAQTDRTVNQ